MSAAELYAGVEDEDTPTSELEGGEKSRKGEGGIEYDIIGEDGQLVMRTNREIIDDSSQQVMTMDEIERLKADGLNGKDLVSKILDSHSGLDQKTAFALAKYTLRKTRKYLKRFTVLPLDVATLVRWMFYDRESMKILEIREEILALIGSWSNLHYTPAQTQDISGGAKGEQSNGRWLAVDETGGLIVAYMAERLGLLYDYPESDGNGNHMDDVDGRAEENENAAEPREQVDQGKAEHRPGVPRRKRKALADTNTIHLIHAASQPNLSLLKYFHFDPNNASPTHPLTTHLKYLSWLQLLHPTEDPGYKKPEELSEEVIKTWKGGRRSNYFKKLRRWERIKSTADEAQAGGFEGLIVASVMQPVTVLRELVPLLKGGAQIVLYSRTIEPLTELADCYSTARRTAFVTDPPDPADMPTEDFLIDPTLVVGTAIHTAKAKAWQTLPGRTHPLMTGRGGTEGFIFTATRVLPAQGKIAARGNAKRRKNNAGNGTNGVYEIDAENIDHSKQEPRKSVSGKFDEISTDNP